jgi:predicted RecB family endonuclease
MTSGETWEHEVADYLRSKGYHAEVREPVKNHEIDVYATRGAHKLIVECKDWNRRVSKDPVRTVHNNSMEIGGTPALAYTSKLNSGAETLADEYDVILLSSDIIRGKVLTIEDVRETVREHSISLPHVPDLSALGNPLGSFEVGSQFAEDVAKKARRKSFEMDSRHENAIENEVARILSEREATQCVPVLRNDRARIDLYFVSDTDHDALPPRIEKESVSLT